MQLPGTCRPVHCALDITSRVLNIWLPDRCGRFPPSAEAPGRAERQSARSLSELPWRRRACTQAVQLEHVYIMTTHICRAAAEERTQELAGMWRAIWRGLSGDVGLWAGRYLLPWGQLLVTWIHAAEHGAATPIPGRRPASIPLNRVTPNDKRKLAGWLPLGGSVRPLPHAHSRDAHGSPTLAHDASVTARRDMETDVSADPNVADDQHWKRDKAEDALRRRRRLRRNFGFQPYEDAPRGGASAPGPLPPDALPSPLPAGKGLFSARLAAVSSACPPIPLPAGPTFR